MADELFATLRKAWESYASAFLAGGLASSVVLGWSGVYRPDPFTGEQGSALADRVAKLEAKIPDKFPPTHWQLQQNTWQNGVQADLNAIREADRHLNDKLGRLEGNCAEHNKEAEDWKRRIERNSQWIEYFREVFQK